VDWCWWALNPTHGQSSTPGTSQIQYNWGAPEPYGLLTPDWRSVGYPAVVSMLRALMQPRSGPASPAPGQRTVPRPSINPGQPIDAYSDTQLLRLAQWIRSDDLMRTQDELLQEMMHELGFQRRGKNVVRRLTTAIDRSAPNVPGVWRLSL